MSIVCDQCLAIQVNPPLRIQDPAVKSSATLLLWFSKSDRIAGKESFVCSENFTCGISAL